MPDIAIDIDWINLDDAFDALEEEVTEVVRGMTVLAWSRVLEETPQFYGRLAASWTYSINVPQFLDRSRLIDVDAINDQFGITKEDEYDETEYSGFPGYYKGHPAALRIANAYSQGAETFFELGDTVYFSNGADHGEGPYAADIERGEIRLRNINQPGKMASRSLDYVARRFANDVRPTVAFQLRTLKIG